MRSLFFLFLISFQLFSQENETIVINGKLLERGTKKPLKDVNVFLLPSKFKAITLSDGSFEFAKVPKGECELIINLVNYNKLSRVNICSEASEMLTLYLEKTFSTTFQTTVKGKYKKRDDQSQSLTQEEFLTMPGSFGGDPVRAAQNLPGVARTGASAQIVIQGASAQDTKYNINGHQVPLVFHFGGLSSVIIPEAVDRVDLLPSGYGPEYSRAIGGVVGLTTKEPETDRTKAMAYVDLFNAGGLIEGPIDDKSSFLVAGRYSYIGLVLKAAAKKNDNFQLTAAPTYLDLTSIYERKINANNKFKTTLIGSRDELKLVLNKAAQNDPALRGNFYNRTGFFRVIPEFTTEFDNKRKLENSVAIGKDYVLVDIAGQYLNIDSSVVTQRTEFSQELSTKYKYFIGLDNQFSWTNVKINLPNTFSVGGVPNPFSVGDKRKFSVTNSQSLIGAYLRQEIKTSETSPWTFLPNVRVDHFSLTKELFLDPRFQMRYRIDDSLYLRASWGTYHQPPRPQESDRLYGNPDLVSPRSIHYTAGWIKDFRAGASEGLEITNNFFLKDLKNIIVPDITKRYSDRGTGEIYGSEVQVKYKWSEWSSQLVYTYLNSTRTIPGYGKRPSEFDQTHNLNLIASHNRNKWTYSARLRLVSGNPYTPITGGTLDSDNDVYIPTRGQIYSQTFSLFNQLDIRIDRKYIYDTWILTAYLDIQNVMNAKNPSSIQYSYDFSQSEKVNGLPILPTLGIKGEF
jgi:hypothetical protein